MTFIQLIGGVLLANVLTVWFIACIVQIAKKDMETPGWALGGAAFCMMFAGIIGYLNLAT